MSASKPKAYRLYDIASMNTKEAISKRLSEFTREDLLIGLPARVTSVKDYSTQQVIDVELIIEDVWVDGRELSAAKLRSIFVKLPSGGGFSQQLPIAVGDLVTLHYTHRSISQFLDGEGANVKQPVDYTATLRDCYATHGFGTRKNNLNPSTEDAVFKGPNTTITVKPNGEYTITTSGNVTLNTEGTTTVNSNGAIAVNTDADATITASGNVNINGSTINNNGSTFKVVTTNSINPLTGTPFPAGSSTLLNSD